MKIEGTILWDKMPKETLLNSPVMKKKKGESSIETEDMNVGRNETTAWDHADQSFLGQSTRVPCECGFTWMHLLAVISFVFCWTVSSDEARIKETQKTFGCYGREYLKVTEFSPSTSKELLTDLELRIPTLFFTHLSLSFPEKSVPSPFSHSLPLQGRIISMSNNCPNPWIRDIP